MNAIKIIGKGYVLQARESEQASTHSYDDMVIIGRVRLSTSPEVSHGDDLNDAPFNCNGDIYDGAEIELKKGDYILVIRNS